jgi:ribosome maturation factor RimP
VRTSNAERQAADSAGEFGLRRSAFGLPTELIAAAARETGVEVYHAEFSGRELRVQIESPSGASVRACSEFSHALTTRLDATDFLRRQYTLEVSTPGIERRLYQPQDYVKAVNQHVRVHARDGVVEGLLEAAGPNGIRLRTERSQKSETRNQKSECRTPPWENEAPREIAYTEIREARIRVSDSELFARSRAETKDPTFNHQDTKVTKQTRPFSFGPVLVSWCLCGELLLRFFGERIT